MNYSFDNTQSLLSLKFETDVLSTNVKEHNNRLRDVMNSPSESEWTNLELDLGKVTMIDSAGLNLLVLDEPELARNLSRSMIEHYLVLERPQEKHPPASTEFFCSTGVAAGHRKDEIRLLHQAP